MSIDDIRIITAATTNYMNETNQLPESLKNTGLKHTVFRYYDAKIPFIGQQDHKTDRKLWIANVNQKIYLLLWSLEVFDEEIIIWTDWDSQVINADWLAALCDNYLWRGVDVAVSEQTRKLTSGQICVDYIGGTIILRNNERAKWFLGEWITTMESVLPGNVDQTSLNRVLDERHADRLSRYATVEKMPDHFVQLFDNRAEGIQPAIMHQLASRRHNAMNGMYGFKGIEQKRDTKTRSVETQAKDNIVFSDFNIPSDSITIVGAAKSAEGCFCRIPDDSYKIACNISILSDETEFDCWLSLDNAMPGKHWFQSVIDKFKGVKIFRKQAESKLIAIAEKYRRKGCKVQTSIGNSNPKYPTDLDNTYWMYTYQSFHDKKTPPMKGIFRHGGTVAAFALQLGWYYGIRKFYLIGVEMKGNEYHVKIDKNPHHGDDEVWDESIYLQTVIDTLKADGCEIYTLSPTSLNLEYPEWVEVGNANIRSE